jgi:serine/threonine protein kinase
LSEKQPILVNGRIVLIGEALALGEIHVDKEIGRGANGVVYRGHDFLLSRDVAIKVWVSKKGDKRNKLQQGLAEAKKIAALGHPNIATVFRAGIHLGRYPFMVMEYVPSTTLRERFAQGLDGNARAGIWSQIAKALFHAHSAGVYHGDLHAGNVLVDNGTAKLVDFGTSLFVHSDNDAAKREASMLRSIVFDLFPGLPREMCLSCFSKLGEKPEMLLVHAKHFVQSMFLEEAILSRISTAPINDLLIRYEIGSLSALLVEVPFADIDAEVKRLLRLGVPERYVKYLIDDCHKLAELEFHSNPEHGMYWTSDITRDVQQMLSDMQPVRNRCQEMHLAEYQSNRTNYLKKYFGTI